jgi:hypothetical protein
MDIQTCFKLYFDGLKNKKQNWEYVVCECELN